MCRGSSTGQSWGSPRASRSDGWPLTHGHPRSHLSPPPPSTPCKDPPSPAGISKYPRWQQALDSHVAGRKIKHTHPQNPSPSPASHFYTQQMFPTAPGINSGHPSAPTLSSWVSKFDFAGRIWPRGELRLPYQGSCFLSLLPYSLACDKLWKERGAERKGRQ